LLPITPQVFIPWLRNPLFQNYFFALLDQDCHVDTVETISTKKIPTELAKKKQLDFCTTEREVVGSNF
jgi:hypothetical protein